MEAWGMQDTFPMNLVAQRILIFITGNDSHTQ